MCDVLTLAGSPLLALLVSSGQLELDVDLVLLLRFEVEHALDAGQGADLREDLVLLVEARRQQGEPEVVAALALVVVGGAGVAVDGLGDGLHLLRVDAQGDERALVAEAA